MTHEQTIQILHENRDEVIDFYKENVNPKEESLRNFMISFLRHAEIRWERRVNINPEKDLPRIFKAFKRDNAYMMKGYVSNWQKAVNYFGYEKAARIANAR